MLTKKDLVVFVYVSDLEILGCRKSSGACELWELQDVIDVPVWSKICEMRSVQFRDAGHCKCLDKNFSPLSYSIQNLAPL